jgi:hypothetical protein
MRRGKEAQERRRQAAEERQAVRDKLSPDQQLARLDALLGENQGATKERLRLHQEIARGEKKEKKKSKKKK